MADTSPPPLEPAPAPLDGDNASDSLFVRQDSTAPPPTEDDDPVVFMREFQRSAAGQLRDLYVAKTATAAGGSSNVAPKVSRPRDSATALYEKLQKKHAARKASGKLTLEEDVAFMRASWAEQARVKKLQEDQEYDNPADTYSPEEDDDEARSELAVPSLDLESDDEDKPKKKSKKRKTAENGGERPKKQAKKGKAARTVPGTDYTEQEVDEVLRSKGKAKSKAKAPRKKGPAGPDITNVHSLWSVTIPGLVCACSKRY